MVPWRTCSKIHFSLRIHVSKALHLQIPPCLMPWWPWWPVTEAQHRWAQKLCGLDADSRLGCANSTSTDVADIADIAVARDDPSELWPLQLKLPHPVTKIRKKPSEPSLHILHSFMIFTAPLGWFGWRPYLRLLWHLPQIAQAAW